MNKVIKLLILPVLAAPALYLAWAWTHITEPVALHFNLEGEPDRFGSKQELLVAMLVLLGVNLGVFLLLSNAYRFDPKRNSVANKERLSRIAFAVSVFLSALSLLIIYNSTVQASRLDIGIILAATGLLFAVIGNYMPNLKPNYFAGIRLPWTLENEENWRRTHALAGRLWFVGGIVLSLACLFLPPTPSIVIFFTGVTVIILVPCIYSYRLYKRHLD